MSFVLSKVPGSLGNFSYNLRNQDLFNYCTDVGTCILGFQIVL